MSLPPENRSHPNDDMASNWEFIKDMKMNIETIDKLETICGETRHGFDYERLIEAMANDDDSRIAGCVYRLMFANRISDLPRLRDSLLDAVADYFDLDDEINADEVDYAEPCYGDFKAERQAEIP
jgi:hypothetical protein